MSEENTNKTGAIGISSEMVNYEDEDEDQYDFNEINNNSYLKDNLDDEIANMNDEGEVDNLINY